MNDNKNKNKNKKQLYRSTRTRRKRYNTKRFKVYQFKIRTALIKYVTPEYTEKNLKFIINRLIRDTEVFQQLTKQFQQFKLDKVTFLAIPRQIGGTDPAPVWIYLDTNDNVDAQFNYASLQELQGSRRLPVKHLSLTSYSSTGRQNDFHYWYDMTEATFVNGLAIRLHSEATPSDQKFWEFQLEFDLKFRGYIVPVAQESRAEQVVNSKSTSTKVVEEQAPIENNKDDQKEEETKRNEEEEEEKIWHDVDSE
jgi:hypothetical protein